MTTRMRQAEGSIVTAKHCGPKRRLGGRAAPKATQLLGRSEPTHTRLLLLRDQMPPAALQGALQPAASLMEA